MAARGGIHHNRRAAPKAGGGARLPSFHVGEDSGRGLAGHLLYIKPDPGGAGHVPGARDRLEGIEHQIADLRSILTGLISIR